MRNRLPRIYEKINSILNRDTDQIYVKNYCPVCQRTLGHSSGTIKNLCSQCGTVQNDPDTFHFVSIKKQLKRSLKTLYPEIEKYKEQNINFLDLKNSRNYKRCTDKKLSI